MISRDKGKKEEKMKKDKIFRNLAKLQVIEMLNNLTR